ncbi:MAG: aldehyde dehydrogenase family protein [Dehalococcoidia bacterium]|nr:aldehyde dehydrogenase family protein [Dehalococcoidia bacterium]MSQ34588.1 aldehyde dehydrogenase family protein [Dehalococcoidia bacterium]
MKMYMGGEWVSRSKTVPVTNPFTGQPFDSVPVAGVEDVDLAVKSAVRGAAAMRKLSAFDRYEVLMKAVGLLKQRAEDIARTITAEEGKIIAEARTEVARCVQTLTWSAEEAKRLYGETIPLDASPGNAMKFGFTVRVPVGVVAAISPFNFPLNLVAHKVGPALAAGNAVVIKPASDTPLSALKLTEVLLDAGIPPEAIQCVTGPGGSIGDALVSHPDVRKVTFTGSRDIGERICKTAGLKKVTMELGSNSPLIVLPDADLIKVAEATVASGYGNAGQVCISTQRVIVDKKIYVDYLDILTPMVAALSAGDPMHESVKVGPMVRERDAERVEGWIREAAHSGARVLTGGERSGAVMRPTVIADVKPEMKVSCEEIFGPAVAVTPASDIDEAIRLANSTRYGLAAAIFTQDINKALKFALEVDSGNLNINGGTSFRADMMPYGGLKDSGMGKEGPRYAVEEMTELKMVIIHR